MVLGRKRFGTVVLAVGVVLLLVGLLAMPAVAQDDTDPGAGEDQYVDQGDDQCPGAEVVATVGPTTDEQREPFTITGQTFRVNYTVEFLNPGGFQDFTIDITDRFGLVESISTDEDETQSVVVPEGPGNFELVTDVEPENGAEYTIIVEDCTGAGQQPPVTITPQVTTMTTTMTT